MTRVGATLFKTLASFQVYGANTNVGKTVASTLLCKAFSENGVKTLYIKPVSTGPIEETDSRHISRYAAKVPSDAVIVQNTFDVLQKHQHDYSVAILETAGGVLSPAPSGNSQADLYRPMRLPTILVGDCNLGGIATTLSAYESLKLRGYDVMLHAIFQNSTYMNSVYLKEYFAERNIPTLSLPKLPPRLVDRKDDEESMSSFYSNTSKLDIVISATETLLQSHTTRLSDLETFGQRALDTFWFPFMQHKNVQPKDIVAVDSAYQDHIDALRTDVSPDSSLLQLGFDASASWWTQGFGHGNPHLALTAAYAAGRYGHVIFAGVAHEPALGLAGKLLQGHANPRLAKVFFSDNGSTGIEVALKMALRASCKRYKWPKDHVRVLGLIGSYHGDTIGALKSTSQSVYNQSIEWYQPRGSWLSSPAVFLKDGIWKVKFPPDMTSLCKDKPSNSFASLGELFDAKRFQPGSSLLYTCYETFIIKRLQTFATKKYKFGALIIEPMLHGAGGMVMCDPLYQHILVKVIREQPELIDPDAVPATDPKEWSGLPIVFDEVFVGLTRLGPSHFNTSGMLRQYPDIVINAKLLTGGLLPLATTTASQSIYNDFISDSKVDALLHGHSYTAHPSGCAVGVEALKMIAAKKKHLGPNLEFGSVWDEKMVQKISHLECVQGVVALGTVLAVTLRDSESGSGYLSTAAEHVKRKLAQVQENGFVHERILGNVLYFMAGLETKADVLREVETTVYAALST